MAPDFIKTPSEREILAEASNRLLRSAEGTLREAAPRRPGAVRPHDDPPRALSEFVQIYREWITLERGELGTQQEQADQWQMLVHCMVNAATIGDAIGQLVRFSPVVWKDRAPSALRAEGEGFALRFNDPFRPGPSGLIASIWLLSLILSTLEFLAQARFAGASGRVIHEPCLSDGVDRLLFDAPITYDQDEVALLIPRRDLRRPVAVRAGDLPQFFRQILPLTLGAVRSVPGMHAMVAGLIRDRKQGPIWQEIRRDRVAAMLGISEATMRRRLGSEGVTFRQVRDEVYNALAMEWLECGDIPIATIAERLGFSDAFAFRRFFSRRHQQPPSAFRKAEAIRDRQQDD